MVARRLLLVLATCIAPAAAPGQTLVFEVDGASALARVGDLDGDGVAELAIGAQAQATVRLVSGADGSVLQILVGSPGSGFGAALAGPGDLTGDGVPDLVVGAPDTNGDGPPSGAVHFVSLATGLAFAEAQGAGRYDRLGHALAVLPDLDGDGVHELAASAPDDGSFVEGENGSVVILSGATAVTLALVTPPALAPTQFEAGFGRSLARAGDLDGDGVDDLLVGMPGFFLEGTDGHVFGFASASLLDPGGPAPVFDVSLGTAGFGDGLANAGDVDDDGVADVLAGAIFGIAPGPGTPAGVLLSGADGELLQVIEPSAQTSFFGRAVAGPGDLDQDGVPDLLVGGPGGPVSGLGRVMGVSGASGETLFELAGVASLVGGFGAAVTDLGDLTGDGVHEFGLADTFSDLSAVYSVLGVWTDLGFGLAGAAGTPTLAGEGQLLGGDALCVTVAGGPPGAPGWLFLGFGFVSAPFFGGTMVPEWITIHDLPPLDATGALQLPGRWPVDAPSVALYAQAWFLDPTGPQGASATNGVEAKAP
jgi:hypothetical protein